MPSWLPSIPYAQAGPGYWNPVTSTINWCEEDYYATFYAAEIVNTLTNLLFMWFACKGILSCTRNGHDTIFLVSYIGYLLVGSGSFLFHATLKYPMQLVDELSMIYTTCLMSYAVFSYARSVSFRIALAAGLVFLAVFITLYYHYLQDPAFHQNAYALLTTIIVFRSMYVMEFTLRPSLRKSEEKHRLERKANGATDVLSKEKQKHENVRDKQILKTMWIMVAFGLSIFLGGFAIWTLDNKFCGELRRWRHDVGLPWGILSEGHGWWHLMTGTGAYFYIMWGTWLRHCLNGRQEEYELYWPHVWSLPDVVKVSGKKQQMHANGDAKKSR